MRSSKSRSRSKSNRPRSVGNNVNRVFDSSGPEGKVRGTPQQIIDKYLMLARDAQLSNDRVAELNFLQHAEHYTRMLSEAMRELAREQESRQNQGGGGHQSNGNHQNNGNGQSNGGQNSGGQNNGGQPGDNQPADNQPGGQQGGGYSNQRRDRRDNRNDDEPRNTSASVVLDTQDDDGPGLVETPEARREPRRQSRMMPEMPMAPDAPAASAQPEVAKPPRAPRPRKPRAEKPDAPQGGSEPSAAE